MKRYQNVYDTFAKTRNRNDLISFFNQLQTQSKYYSFYNATLICAQRPGCGYVLSEYQWKKNGFAINVGATPIVILQTFGPVAFLYEQSDVTLVEDNPNGKRLLEKMKSKKMSTDNHGRQMNELDYVVMKMIANSLGVYVIDKEMGSRNGGSIKVDAARYQVLTEDKVVMTPVVAIINSNHDFTTRTVTLLHELGHYLCGHLSEKMYGMKLDKKIFNMSRDEFNYLSESELDDIQEYEAEMVAKLVSAKLGIENTCWDEYFDNNKVMEYVNMDFVIKAVDMIIKRCIAEKICENEEVGES